MVNIPSIRDIYEDIINDLQTEYGFTISTFGKVFLRAVAWVQAAKLKLLYLAVASVQKNIFPDTAEPESVGGSLERFGRVKIGRMPFPATPGIYQAKAVGEIGSTIPAGTMYKSSFSSVGKLYATTASYTFTTTTDIDIEITAVEAGLESSLNIDDELLCTVPIAGVDRTIVINNIITHPTAQESIEEYRRVVLESFRMLPQGGAVSDYRLWCQDAVGVKQSYPYAVSGSPNEIDIYIEASIADSVDGMGTPTPTILSNAELVVETDPFTGKGRRPLGVFAVNIKPVVIDEITINISDFIDLTTEKEALILSAIKDRIDNMRPFIPGADVADLRDDKISNHIVIAEILSAVPGSSFGAVQLVISTGGGTPTVYTERMFTYGRIPFLIDINYV